MISAVSDTTLLSNFSHAGCPDLPKLAFPGLIMPGVVLEEFLDLEISGTLGALCNLVDQEHLTIEAAEGILAKMRLKGYRSPVPSLKMLLGT